MAAKTIAAVTITDGVIVVTSTVQMAVTLVIRQVATISAKANVVLHVVHTTADAAVTHTAVLIITKIAAVVVTCMHVLVTIAAKNATKATKNSINNTSKQKSCFGSFFCAPPNPNTLL